MIHGQVTDSLDYLLEVEIERTKCKKTSGRTENCLAQEDPQMQKVGAETAFSNLELSCLKSLISLQILLISYLLLISALTGLMQLLEILHFRSPIGFELICFLY